MINRVRPGTLAAVAAFAAALMPAAARAQRQERAPSVFRITPYVGMMVFGKYLQGPLNTSITSDASPIYGAQVALDIAPDLSVVGNLGYADSKMRIGVPILGGLSLGTNKVLLYDGALQYRFATGGARASTLRPFVEAGAGAIRYDINNDVLTTTATNFAFNFGGGLDYAVTPSVGLHLMAKDYVGKFNFKQATGLLDLQGNTAHNVAITAGASFNF